MTVIKQIELGDLIEFQRGYDLPKSEMKEGIYPVRSSNGILGYHNEFKVKGPGITIGRSGTVGIPHLVKENFYPHNTSLFIKDFKGNDIEYVFYLLKQLKLGDKKSGSGVPTMNRNHLHPLKILAYENKDVQKKVAKVLSDIDSKIELNNKINAELEAMAKLIYDYWFVQFDFPISETQAQAMGRPELKGKPYKSSGGKMSYNPQLKRETPEVWEVFQVKDVLKTDLGGTPSTKVEAYWNGDIPWLNSGEIANFPIISSEFTVTQQGIDNSATSLIPANSCVLSITRHLRPSILGVDSCVNQSVVGLLESETLKSAYIYPYLVNEIPRLMSLRTGAQQPHINKGIVDESSILTPPENILEQYYQIVNPNYKQITNHAIQNQKLIELRDWLLPMLMNGQVKVK